MDSCFTESFLNYKVLNEQTAFFLTHLYDSVFFCIVVRLEVQSNVGQHNPAGIDNKRSNFVSNSLKNYLIVY